MSKPWRALRTALRLLPVVAALAVAVSGSGVRPATLTLTELETAEGYDVGAGVVWASSCSVYGRGKAPACGN